MKVPTVAQICNLLYRRFIIGSVSICSSAPRFPRGPQNPILRYSRLKICATIFKSSGLGLFCMLFLACGVSAAFGRQDASKTESIPPKSPQESLAMITTRAGLKVELVAAEPLIVDP